MLYTYDRSLKGLSFIVILPCLWESVILYLLYNPTGSACWGPVYAFSHHWTYVHCQVLSQWRTPCWWQVKDGGKTHRWENAIEWSRRGSSRSFLACIIIRLIAVCPWCFKCRFLSQWIGSPHNTSKIRASVWFAWTSTERWDLIWSRIGLVFFVCHSRYF